MDDIPDHELTTILEKRCALLAACLAPAAVPWSCACRTPLDSNLAAKQRSHLNCPLAASCLPTFSACRCAIAPSYAAKLVAVQGELQRRRSASNVFAGRHGFITPRDLFRWVGLPVFVC